MGRRMLEHMCLHSDYEPNYLWDPDKNACGLAINMDKKTEINYIAEKSSFLVNSMFSAGSVGIDAEGIVEVTCRE